MDRTLTALFFCLVIAGNAVAQGIDEVLKAPGRSEADIARDTRSRPDVVVPLLDLKAGDRVADIFAGGGYYSDILAGVVGSDGEVLLQNNRAYRNFASKALTDRFEGRNPENVTFLISEADDLKLGQSNLDAALIIMSYHDLYHQDPENGWAAINASRFLEQIYTALKPGGRFLIVDHMAEEMSGNSAAQELHRIDIDFAKQDITSHGFELTSVSEVLRNPDDDRSLMVFDPKVRGKTDRFILLFSRPIE